MIHEQHQPRGAADRGDVSGLGVPPSNTRGGYLELEDPAVVSLLAGWAQRLADSRPPNEVIARGSPYIRRWYLARKAMVPARGGPLVEREAAEGGWAPELVPAEIENLYLHRYLRADPEHMHDHPWPNGTLVLRGRLVELTPAGRRVLLPGDIVLRAADQAHAIVDVEPGTLTLFATLRKERDWGFIDPAAPGGWTRWDRYRPAFRSE